jgi:calmodulin
VLDLVYFSQLHRAFRAYDKDENGLLAVNDLRNVLTTLGEPLTYDQFEELIAVLNVDAQGKVKSSNFIEILLKKRT